MPPATTTLLQRFTSSSAILDSQVHTLSASVLAAYIGDLPWLEVFGLLVTFAFIAGTVSIIMKTQWLDKKIKKLRGAILTTEVSRRQAAKSWNSVQRHFFAGNDNDIKVAIIEADKMLDEALRNAGVLGNTLGDRLKKVRPGQLPHIENVWQAHKLRNQIAHEGDFSVKRDVAERALTIYKEALQSLGAIPKEGNSPKPAPPAAEKEHGNH